MSDAGFSIVAVVKKLEFPNRGDEGQYKKIRVEASAHGPDATIGDFKTEGWRTKGVDDDTEHPWVSIIERAAKTQEPIKLKGFTEPYEYTISRGPRKGQKGKGLRYNLNNAGEWDGVGPEHTETPPGREPQEAATAPQQQTTNGHGRQEPGSVADAGVGLTQLLVAGLAVISAGPQLWLDDQVVEGVDNPGAAKRDWLISRAGQIVDLAKRI